MTDQPTTDHPKTPILDRVRVPSDMKGLSDRELLTLVERAEDYRTEYNEVRPHEAIAWNRPLDVHLGLADPTIPNFEREEILPTT